MTNDNSNNFNNYNDIMKTSLQAFNDSVRMMNENSNERK